MLHGEAVDASGDGQTTRMDVVYNLGVFCDSPKIKISFQKKDDFVNKMKSLTCLNCISYIFQNRYYFPYINLEEDLLGYLRIVLQPLELLGKMEYSGRELFDKKLLEDINKVTYMISQGIRKGDDAEKEEIVEIYEEIQRLFAKICDEHSKIFTPKKIGAIFRMDWQEHQRKQMHEKGGQYNDQEKDLQEYIQEMLELDEQEIEKYCDRLNSEQSLFDVLNRCKGYFDVREFYFLFSESPEEGIKSLVAEVKHFFENDDMEEQTNNDESGIEKGKRRYYESLYILLFDQMKRYFEIDSGFTIELRDNNERERDVISLCLKVVNGNSLTGIVKQIEIEDMLSNKYALMVRRCGINNIKLRDTCGLDHIERGTGIKRYLTKKFLEYSDKGTKFNAIFYMKKLDAGKPVELERILPNIYSNVPDQPIFTIFTGADIFYEGREDILVNYEWNKELYEMEKKNEKMRIPKSIEYFYDNENIVRKLSCSDERRKKLHRVIKENLVPFVSDTDNKEYKNFTKSNRRYLKKIFEAILLDEWNSGYIDSESIQKMLEEPRFIEALDEDILRMFWEASLYDWRYRHHMTVNANANRISGKTKNDKHMGYNGIHLDRWDVLLKKGFQKVFLSGESQVIEVLSEMGIAKGQLESMFGKLKEEIVPEDIKYREISDESKETEFRVIFRSMYNDKKCYLYNPYEDNTEEVDKMLKDQDGKKTYLKEICNFQKGLKNEKVKEQFRNLFIGKIEDYIKDENKKHVQKLLKYKSGFGEKVEEVIEEIKSFTEAKNSKWVMEVFEIFLASKLG